MLTVQLVTASLAASTPAAPPFDTDLPPIAAVTAAPPGAIEPSRLEDVETVQPPQAPETQPLAANPPAEPFDEGPADDPEFSDIGLESDPLEGFNRPSFEISMAVDRAVIRPVAMAYRTVVPRPARDGVRNALSNIGEPLVFLNDFLQLRPRRMLSTLFRFVINSTLGLGGLFDITRREPFGLPHRDNGFGDTLGYYGVGPGPYIYLPIIGPTTLRDALGSAEKLIPPKLVGSPFDRTDYIVTTTLLDGIDTRERSDDELNAMLSGAIDPYATLKANYLQNRAGEIAALKAEDGEAPVADGFDDPLIDPAAPAQDSPGETAPSSQ